MTYPTINFATLWTNCTTKYSRIERPPCISSPYLWTNPAIQSSCLSRDSKEYTDRKFIEDHCYPQLNWPSMESLQALHTAWKACNLAGVDSSIAGIVDPLQTLGPRTAMVGSTQTKALDLLTTSAPASPAPQLVPPQPEKTFSRSASQASSDPSSNDPGSIYGPSSTGGILPPSKTQRLATQAAGDSVANKPPLALQSTSYSPVNGELLPSSTTKGVGPQQGSDSEGNAADLAHQGIDNPPAASLGPGYPSVVGPHAPDPPARPAPTTLFSNLYDPSFSIKAVEIGPAAKFETGSFSVAGPQPSASPASSPPVNSPTNGRRPSESQGDAPPSQPILSQELLAATTLAAQVFTHAASRPTGIAADFSEMPGILHTSAAFVAETSKLTDVSSMPLSETDHVDGLVSDGLDPSRAFNFGNSAGVTAQPAAEPLSSNGVIVASVRVSDQAEVPPIIVGTVMYSPVLPATRVPKSSEAGGSSNLPSGGSVFTSGQPNAIPESTGGKEPPSDGTARPNTPLGSANAIVEQPGLTSLMPSQQPIITAPRSAIPGLSNQAFGDEGPARSQIDPPAGQTNYAPAQANNAPIIVGGTTYTPVPANPTTQAAYVSSGDTSPQHPLSSNLSHGSTVSGTTSSRNSISGNSLPESPPSIGSGSIIPKSTTTNSTQAFSSAATAGVSTKPFVGGVARVAVDFRGSMVVMLGWMTLTF